MRLCFIVDSRGVCTRVCVCANQALIDAGPRSHLYFFPFIVGIQCDSSHRFFFLSLRIPLVLIFRPSSVVIKYTLTYFISFEGTWWDMQTFDNKSWGKGSLYPLQIRLQDSLLFGRCTRLIIRDDDSTQSPNLNVDVISCTTEKKKCKMTSEFLASHTILLR